MFFHTFVEPKLAHNAYLVGCQATGEAIIIDPGLDLDLYVRTAQAEGLRIVAVAETHIHADFVAGSRALAEQTGAMLYLSAAGGWEWRYAYASSYPHRLLNEGDAWRIGQLKFLALHTPGHTPEHLSFLLTDCSATSLPLGLFTGDFLFVGDVGRPDLLETAMGIKGSKLVAARQLFHTLQRFKQLPGHLQIWPGHGAGSICGKSIGGAPSSTLGYERQVNWAFQIDDEATFVTTVLDGQPEPPRYFAAMKRINQRGAQVAKSADQPPKLDVVRLAQLQYAGAMIVDTRSPAEFTRGHVPGSINLPFASRTFPTYAGSFLDNATPFYLIIGPAEVADAVKDLRLIGLNGVAGYFAPQVVEEWSHLTGEPLAVLEAIEVEMAAGLIRSGEATVIDVRSASEFAAGHLPRARNVVLNHILEQIEEIPMDRMVILNCKSGFRSTIAASLLRSQGRTNVFNLHGGLQMWMDAQLPVVDGTTPTANIRHRQSTRPKPARRRSPAPPVTPYFDPANLPYWMEFSPQQLAANPFLSGNVRPALKRPG
jgi:hydroxyacylglutathione hydrolase